MLSRKETSAILHKRNKPKVIQAKGSHRLAKFTSSDKIWVNPKLPEYVQQKIRAHMGTYKVHIQNGESISSSVEKAFKREHSGMTKKQVQVYEGRLGAFSKTGIWGKSK